LKVRSFPQIMCSVTCGNAMQMARIVSASMSEV
jgi:hypothetical protein